MIKKDNRLDSQGRPRTQIRVVEGYRVGPGLPTKQRTIKDFGILEDQEDPQAFMEMVKQFNAAYKSAKVPLRIEAHPFAKMYSKENRRYNYGYKFFAAVYDMLKIDGFVKSYLEEHGFAGKYSVAKILKFLVILRLLSPDSKRATFQMKEVFYSMDTDFSLQDIYRSLDKISDFEVELQRHLNEQVKETVGRDLSHAFYDVTNYFFDIDFCDSGEDGLRKHGVSKEHRVAPIAAMGLFTDSNGLPVSMSIFPGNTSDTLTLQPTIKEIKQSYGLGRIVVVGDKGINSSKNIDAISNQGDGFVFSQVLKGKKGQRYSSKLFDDTDWTVRENGAYKYKLFEEEYKGKDSDGKPVTRKRKVLLYWSKSEDDIAKRRRMEKLERTRHYIKNSACQIKNGVEKYTKEDIIDKETGEILEDILKHRTIDTEKAEHDAMYDGYFSIITSELSYDERKIRQVYGGLWKIEQSFRIMKSDLYARPVFVSKNNHIRAHFLICFVALLIIRIIQQRMGKKALSAERISRALNSAVCNVFTGGIVHLADVGGAIAFKKRTDKTGKIVDTLEYSNEDQIAQDYKSIQELFGTNCYNAYLRLEVFNSFLKKITLA
ncbi:MAG: IS1634 family transposase [Chitinispirillales bacterium]|jgi:transposase|nr:IS1634 family transposase [Chitinispirillales bacterium]